jgi:hypothetical protein
VVGKEFYDVQALLQGRGRITGRNFSPLRGHYLVTREIRLGQSNKLQFSPCAIDVSTVAVNLTGNGLQRKSSARSCLLDLAHPGYLPGCDPRRNSPQRTH